ncbi:MAG: hypothetical protein WC537_01595 [Candidatus Paceibacterota bacterium]
MSQRIYFQDVKPGQKFIVLGYESLGLCTRIFEPKNIQAADGSEAHLSALTEVEVAQEN